MQQLTSSFEKKYSLILANFFCPSINVYNIIRLLSQLSGISLGGNLTFQGGAHPSQLNMYLGGAPSKLNMYLKIIFNLHNLHL